MTILTDERIDEAIRRLALTPDGRALYLRLQRVLMSLGPSDDPGALQAHEGRRRFALDLKALLDEGLAESASAGSGPEPERPVVIVARQPSAGARARGVARRAGLGADGPDAA